MTWQRTPPDCGGLWLARGVKAKLVSELIFIPVFTVPDGLRIPADPKWGIGIGWISVSDPRFKGWWWFGPIPKLPEEVTHDETLQS